MFNSKNELIPLLRYGQVDVAVSAIKTRYQGFFKINESIHLVWATFDSTKVLSGSVYGLDDGNEDILLHLISRDEALLLLEQGKISNAATIIGLQWLAMNYQML